MVIAQELVGRPFVMLFGFKATTIVWILIAVVLGLIFSMTMWPHLWRSILHKRVGGEGRMQPKEVAILSIMVGLIAFIFGFILGGLIFGA